MPGVLAHIGALQDPADPAMTAALLSCTPLQQQLSAYASTQPSRLLQTEQPLSYRLTPSE